MQTVHTPSCAGLFERIYATTDRNQKLSGEVFQLYQCKRCGLVKLESIPENLATYYPSSYYKIPTYEQIEKKADQDYFKIDLVKRFVPSGSILEIGAAYGIFALQAKKQGYKMTAIEFDPQCCDFLKNNIKVNTINSSMPESALTTVSTQDAIAIWHVIEHLSNPWAVIEQACKKLNPGGHLFIAAPNPESFQHRVMRSHWPHTDAPRHLYLIPSKALIEYAQSCGMELVHCTTSDRYAYQMNRFGWQRLLMNTVNFYPFKVALYVVGYVLHLVMMGFDRKEGRGSAYTLVLRKSETTSESSV